MSLLLSRQLDLDGMPDRLRHLREARGYTVRGLADELDRHHQQVHGWETGRNTMTLRSLKRFADKLGLTRGEILWLLHG